MSGPTGRTRSASPKDRLRRALRDEVDGKRTCVFVLGDGVNRQAVRTRPGRPTEWHRVLGTIWGEAGGAPEEITPIQQSPVALWAALVRQWSAHHRLSQARSEQAVRSRLCALFEPIEAEERRRQLYARMLDGRLANVVSFSVDRRLVLHSGAGRVVARRARASFLERYLEVTGPRGRTKVWFPYGETSRAASIDVGYTAYDARLMILEKCRAKLMDESNKWDYGYGPGLLPPISVYPDLWDAPPTWCHLFLCAPLVFVGTSLPADDWPLWWLLHQRARYFVPFQEWEIAETFYLTSRETNVSHVQNGAASLEVVTFKDYDKMWTFILTALDAPGVDLHEGWDRRFGRRRTKRT
jgi:hypothetical protein